MTDIHRSGPDIVRDYASRLPHKPGVYRMIDAEGAVLYVGKAKDLQKRVLQYAQGKAHANRITRMVQLTASMEFVVTETETEALLLEINLIKALKPRFNVLLRDDKSFPYILIRKDHASPQLMKHRGARSMKGAYFGPFASAGAVNRTLNTLQKAFLLRSCSDSVFESRTRPCMLHQIKRCAAPCVDLIAPSDYLNLANEAERFLTGKSADLPDDLARQMEAAAGDLEFERAARLRDRIRALAAIRASQGVNPQGIDEADVFSLASDGGQTCIQVFFFRVGQNWGNRAFFPKHDRDLEPEDILDGFIGQFYEDKPAPGLILTSHLAPHADLLGEALSLKSDRKVILHYPQRGEKRDLVLYALSNAREALARRLAESAAQGALLDNLVEAFDLDGRPDRIEVYDNSHIMGANAVGAMIVAGPSGFEKNQYRKFNIKSADLTPGDDYGMMREVLRRRFQRLLKEDEAGADAIWPDLVLIDGGLGQFNAARETLTDLGVWSEVKVVGIAKGIDRDAGREQFFVEGRAPFRLDERAPVLYFLQRLRDEAHRFAIGAHRQKRSADITKNPLDEIAGIGPARKRALLHRFGSARGVSRAALADLETVDGVSKDLAQRIFAHFRRE